MQLTDHFSLEELTATAHRGVNNDPPPAIVEKLKLTAQGLEHVRVLLGVPIIVSSGYRSPELNLLVGGSVNSQHMRGEACDFIAPKFGTPLQVCRAIEASSLQFDQLIFEGSWAHISFVSDRKPRRSVMTARFVNGKATYSDGII